MRHGNVISTASSVGAEQQRPRAGGGAPELRPDSPLTPRHASFQALAPTEPKVTRLEASRTLGILGALDPVQVWEEEKHNEQFDKPLRSPSQSSNESQYAAVGVAVVHRVLQDSDPCPVPRAERLTQTLDGRTVRSRSISGSNR